MIAQVTHPFVFFLCPSHIFISHAKGQCVHLCQGRTEQQCLEPGANVCMWIPFHQKKNGGVCTNVERTIASKVEMAKIEEEKVEGEKKLSPVRAEKDVNEAAESSLSSSPEDATMAGEVVEISPLEPLNDEKQEKEVEESSSSSSIPPPSHAHVVEEAGEAIEDVPPLEAPALVEAEETVPDETVEEMQIEASLPGNAPKKDFIKVGEMARKEDLLRFHGLDDGTLVCPSKSPDDPATSLKIASMWNGMMTVMIDWGDGTPEERHRMSVGAFSSTNFDHSYMTPGMYAITASATVRRIKDDDDSGEAERISVEYLSHVGVRESCTMAGSFFGSVSVNCEAIDSETSDQFYLAKVCFGPQKDQILDYSIDWGMAPMDFFTGRVFEMGQMVCHSRLYRESGRHILLVQVENSNGSLGAESSDIVLRQRISVTSSACRIADSDRNERRLRGLAM